MAEYLVTVSTGASVGIDTSLRNVRAHNEVSALITAERFVVNSAGVLQFFENVELMEEYVAFYALAAGTWSTVQKVA